MDGAPADQRCVTPMLQALAHRGPDDQGLHIDGPVVLGHLRLSILGPGPQGAQPMHRSGATLIHNGEAYNYLELAAELRQHGEVIQGNSDTEVILAAYRVWGVDAVKRLNGMFAFALWDSDRRRLLLARDRMGVKPLYLRRTARSLAFASEPRAFLQARPLDPTDTWKPEPHLGVVHDFLARGVTDHSLATFVSGITALPPAHLLVVEDGVERLVRYWGPPRLADDDRPGSRATDSRRDAELVEEFASTFDSAVRLRLRSDVQLGTCLSGGLDSSSIVSTVAALLPESVHGSNEQFPRLGFHARFPAEGLDESRFAALVAERAGLQLVTCSPSGSPLLASLMPVLRAQGEPFPGASISAQYAVMAAAHDRGLKVLLDGQGADELLGGYLQFLGVRATGLARRGLLAPGARELRNAVALGTLSTAGAVKTFARSATPRWLIEATRATSRGRLGVACAPVLRREGGLGEVHSEPGTLLARQLWQSATSDSLPALLRFEDRNSMAFGIEARVPFLDVRLVELAVRLPDRLRIGQGVTKRILRRAMRGRVPDAVLRRTDKMGFLAPDEAWLKAGSTEVVDLLRNSQIVDRGWVAQREVQKLVDGGADGIRRSSHLWRLFVLEAWLRDTWPEPNRSLPEIQTP